MMKIKTIKNKYGSFTVYGTDQWFNRATLPLAKLQHEKPLVAYLENQGKKYDFFLDVGANYGYFSVIASHFIPTVYAFEAHPIRYGFLHWNVQDISNIIPVNTYIGNSTNITTAKDPSGMVASHKQNFLTLRGIPTHPLDSFVLEPNKKHLVKVDVEGNELDVLESGRGTIGLPNVDWLVEIHKYRGIPEEKVFSYFEGYKRKVMMGGQQISHYLFRR